MKRLMEQVMTRQPHTIGMDQPIAKAIELMRQHHIRHLPVQKGGKLVGILTDRDIKLASSFQGAAEFTVEDVMTPEPYTVTPSTELKEVVRTMAEHKYGAALVQAGDPGSKNAVIGIFTSNDALRLLATTLE